MSQGADPNNNRVMPVSDFEEAIRGSSDRTEVTYASSGLSDFLQEAVGLRLYVTSEMSGRYRNYQLGELLKVMPGETSSWIIMAWNKSIPGDGKDAVKFINLENLARIEIDVEPDEKELLIKKAGSIDTPLGEDPFMETLKARIGDVIAFSSTYDMTSDRVWGTLHGILPFRDSFWLAISDDPRTENEKNIILYNLKKVARFDLRYKDQNEVESMQNEFGISLPKYGDRE